MTKWQYNSKNLAEGDLVILREDNMMPTKWPLARVSRVHPGKDGIARVVTVKTPSSTRPVAKVAPCFVTNDIFSHLYC